MCSCSNLNTAWDFASIFETSEDCLLINIIFLTTYRCWTVGRGRARCLIYGDWGSRGREGGFLAGGETRPYGRIDGF